jgi:hypothetical protein
MMKSICVCIGVAVAVFFAAIFLPGILRADDLQDKLTEMQQAVDAIPAAGSSECPEPIVCQPPVVCEECPTCPDPVVEPYPVDCPDGGGSVVVVEKIVEVPLVPRSSDTQAMIDMAKSIGIRTEITKDASGGVSISWTYPEWIREHMGSPEGMRGYMHNDYSNGTVQ